MDDETIDLMRRARGVCNSSHCAARKTKEIEAIEPGGLNDGLEIVDKSLEGEFDPVAIRQSTPALIEPDQRMPPSQQSIPVTPNRTILFQVDARHPMWRSHQYRTGAAYRIGDASAITTCAKAYRLR
jgi:hypothetical protein